LENGQKEVCLRAFHPIARAFDRGMSDLLTGID
jgi:hypothetical protein